MEIGGGNYALIIGETHPRSNLSAYGYERNTTPWLSQFYKDGHVVLLDNGYSCAAQTSPVLEFALTAKNQYNDIMYKDAYTIVEIAKAAGFDVVWVSNQVDDNIAGRIGHQADFQYWLNKNHNDTWMRQKNNTYDSNVIQCLKAFDSPKKKTLYIINLLGSHASYDCRYPKEFRRWDDKDSLINAFDNSVLYNDYIMSQIYDILFLKLNVDAMMYFADHGEELKIKFCHGNEFFYSKYKQYPSVKEIVKVPIYFAFSERYKTHFQDKINALINNKGKYYTNDMVYDTMLGIMNINKPYYNDIFDITSEHYSLKLEDLRTLHGKVKIQDCL